MDSKGRNYLHVAVSNNNVDNVLFLISIEVDVNSRIQDGSNRTPLHLAIPTGSEIIVRHLVSVTCFNRSYFCIIDLMRFFNCLVIFFVTCKGGQYACIKNIF